MLRALSVPLPENGAHIQGLRLEGPFLNPVKRGAHKQELLIAPDARLLEKFLSAAQGKLRQKHLGPQRPGALLHLAAQGFVCPHTACNADAHSACVTRSGQ